ncbi:MAG TPA: hypothetical protein VGL81_31295 [Polyangiaceae bacterium]
MKGDEFREVCLLPLELDLVSLSLPREELLERLGLVGTTRSGLLDDALRETSSDLLCLFRSVPGERDLVGVALSRTKSDVLAHLFDGPDELTSDDAALIEIEVVDDRLEARARKQ